MIDLPDGHCQAAWVLIFDPLPLAAMPVNDLAATSGDKGFAGF